VDNQAERIGGETVMQEKDQVKGNFGVPQGYPPNLSTIHSSHRSTHRSSTCRPQVRGLGVVGWRSRPQPVDYWRDERLHHLDHHHYPV